MRKNIIAVKKNSDIKDPIAYRTAKKLLTPTVASILPKIKSLRHGADYVINLLKSTPPTYSPFRGGKYLHVSDLIDKCIRKIALAEKNNTTLAPTKLSDSMAMTFGQGDSIHDFIKSRVIAGHPTEIYGQWQCNCGKLVSKPETYSRPKYLCRDCNTHANRYKELQVKNEEHLISGSIDLLLYLNDIQSHYICEIKSINPEAWNELVRPLPKHILQVVFYWYLMRAAGYDLVDQVSILYATKGYVFKLPYKEFIIKPQDHLHRLNDALEDAKARKVSLGGGKLPLRTVCIDRNAKEAKVCEMSVLCFSDR